jgi:hypothetical protein
MPAVLLALLLPASAGAAIIAESVSVVDGDFNSFPIAIGPGDTDVGSSLGYFLNSPDSSQASLTVTGGSSLAGGRLVTGTFGPQAFSKPAAAVTVSGAGSSITLTRGSADADVLDLASQGRGTVLVEQGGRVEYVTLPGTCGPYECSAGTLTNAAGTSGTIVVTGTGSVFDANPEAPQRFNIGRATVLDNGFGEAGAASSATVSILDGGRFETGYGLVAAAVPPSDASTGAEQVSATVNVVGSDSRWQSEFIAVGFDDVSPTAPRTEGLLALEGGTVSALETYIGPTGTLAGVGTVEGDLYNLGGTIAPGLSPGRLEVFGDFFMDSGELLLEIAGFSDPLIDILDVSGVIDITGGDIIFDFLGLTPGTGDLFNPLRAGGGVTIGEGVNLLTRGLAPGFEFDFTDGVITALNDARAVPVPATLWLVLIALLSAATRSGRAADSA